MWNQSFQHFWNFCTEAVDLQSELNGQWAFVEK